MTDREIIEAMDVENRNLRADLNDMEDEIRKLTLALTRINEIVDRHSNDASSSIQKLCAQIKRYCDEERRQDGL